MWAHFGEGSLVAQLSEFGHGAYSSVHLQVGDVEEEVGLRVGVEEALEFSEGWQVAQTRHHETQNAHPLLIQIAQSPSPKHETSATNSAKNIQTKTLKRKREKAK